MGTYLSTPVTDKNEECGEVLTCPETPLRWGVVDMQGWRKSMEDAHVAQTDVEVPWRSQSSSQQSKSHDRDGQREHQDQQPVADAKVFGVFDGHGGPEVARFCQLYLVSVLTQQPAWKAMTQQQVQLPPPQRETNVVAEENSNSGGGARTPKLPRETPVGRALISTFHALDRMIDDPERRYVLQQN